MTGRILPDLTETPSAPPVVVGRRGGKTPPRKLAGIDDDEMQRLFDQGLNDAALAAHFGYAESGIRMHRWAMGLKRRASKGAGGAGLPIGVNSRHLGESLSGKLARMPAFDNPALQEKRSLYPSTVASATGANNLLVSGHNSWKIGAVVTKGCWKGFPIYTLTLEERATCPTSCQHWRSCFGNQMHLAKRVANDDALEARLPLEVGVLAARHPAGFAVRLHVLGDFYSVEYVAMWRALLDCYAALHIFGFTARTEGADPITRAVARVVRDFWPRASLRFSNAAWSEHAPLPATVTIEHPMQKPADAIVCPAQLGQTSNCGTCALCWSTDRRIAFVRH